jgi:OOP family OmpA-OmpF porin
MYKFLLFSFLISTSILFGQDNAINKLSIDGGVGFNNSILPFTSGYSNSYFNPFNLNIGARKMFNNKFGFKVDFGYDYLSESGKSLKFNTHYVRTSFQGVANLATILQFNTFTQKFGLLAHGGAGFSSMLAKNRQLVKETDEMVHLIFGLTPQYKVNEKIALNIDISMIQNFKQHYTFDYNAHNPANARRGSLANLTVGISYKIGPAQRHCDWVFHEEIKDTVIDLTPTEDQVKKIEEGVKDDDKDGVLNFYDEELNTPEGSKVDTKGRKISEDVTETIKDSSTVNNPKPSDENRLGDNSTEIKSLNGMEGLFFTIQVGAYNRVVKVESHKKLKDVYQIKAPDGKTRYCTGVLGTEKEMFKLLNQVRALGFSDAFPTAYYNGERIPIYKARQLLKKNGNKILSPSIKK